MNGREPIFEQVYWNDRLARAVARGQVHRAVYETSEGDWAEINTAHTRILSEHVGIRTSVLDVGCGWGRLLTLMPSYWSGLYLGVDLSKTFIDMATLAYPHRMFLQHDMRQPLSEEVGSFDLGILISIRPMVIGKAGGEHWDLMEYNIRRLCNRILYLEYIASAPGELVIVR